MPPKLKSPDRIEIWRQEVSLSLSAVEATEGPAFPTPVGRRSSLWRKILRRDSSKSGKENGKEDMVKTGMYDGKEGLKDLGDEPGEDDVWAGSSMGISAESELAGFGQRKERLERAARLLQHGSGKRKYGEK